MQLTRDLFDSYEYFSERFTRMQAYLDLCLLAAFSDRSFYVRGNRIDLKEGQLAKSEEELARRWKWSRNTVRAFLTEQQNIGNIEQQKSRLITITTIKMGICFEQQNEQQNQQQKTQKSDTINNINNKKIIKEELSKESPKKKEKNEVEEQMLPLDIEEDKYTFDKVWDLYDKKVGDKDKLRKKWAGIKPKDKIKIFEFIPAYVALTEKAYRKNFQTFLNQKAWTNEDIETNGITVPYGTFNPKLVEDRDLFKQFVINFNNKIRGSGVKEVDLKNGLTEKRRILFNIAYCLHFNQMKKVVENAIKNPRLNGSTGFAADFDYIFKPDNFLRIFEGY